MVKVAVWCDSTEPCCTSIVLCLAVVTNTVRTGIVEPRTKASEIPSLG